MSFLNRLRSLGSVESKTHAVAALAGCVVVAALLMIWLGYRATREWERSTVTASETRAKEILALVNVALERDMKGGHVVLLPFNETMLDQPLYDLADRFAAGFARFPYVESFFFWKSTPSGDGVTVFFNRSDRPPAWDTLADSGDPYPVVLRRDPAPAAAIVAAAKREASRGASFAALDSELAGNPYQVLVHFTFSDRPGDLYGFAGLTVNLDWVRAHYFTSVIEQIKDIGGDQSVGIDIVDDRGSVVARTGPESTQQTDHVRTFPLLFSDRAVMASILRAQRTANVPEWRARVSVANDATVAAVERGVVRTLALLVLAGVVTVAGAVYTVRTARATDNLARLQSEFMTSVTHEMKTPLALIRLAGDTFKNGRYGSPATIQEYGQVLTTESDHLTRLIDNVLCFARISDPDRAYSFEHVDILELLDESIERFRLQVSELAFDLQLHLPIELPQVRADRTMLLRVIDNLIDNALKHGRGGRTLILKAYADSRRAHIEVIDRGTGIPPDEVARVFEKFYRGKGTRQHGTGLGLTIARRIVEEHGGAISIRSQVGQGTSVEVAIPLVIKSA